jgi:hypothetical protein
MLLRKYSLSAAEFATLPISERLFFVRLANIANDLRHVQLLTVREIRAVNEHTGVEREVALHQMIFGLRHWYAILNEAWNVIHVGWNGQRLGRKFYPKLSKGKKAFDELRKYFSGNNLVRTIRDHFASHYEIGYLPRVLDELPASDQYHFVSSERSVNTFYSIAENIRNAALIATADQLGDDQPKLWDEARARVAIRRLYAEAGRVSEKLDLFLGNLLPLILKPCHLKKDSFTSGAVADPEGRHSLIFIDEDAIIRRQGAGTSTRKDV